MTNAKKKTVFEQKNRTNRCETYRRTLLMSTCIRDHENCAINYRTKKAQSHLGGRDMPGGATAHPSVTQTCAPSQLGHLHHSTNNFPSVGCINFRGFVRVCACSDAEHARSDARCIHKSWARLILRGARLHQRQNAIGNTSLNFDKSEAKQSVETYPPKSIKCSISVGYPRVERLQDRCSAEYPHFFF